MAADPDGQYLIDYKCDEAWRRTRNVFIETVSNARTGRRGWALTSEAEWLLYFLTPDRVLVLTFTAVRRHLPTWQARFRLRAAVNDGYDTLGLCVPVSVVETAEYTARLDYGDAANSATAGGAMTAQALVTSDRQITLLLAARQSLQRATVGPRPQENWGRRPRRRSVCAAAETQRGNDRPRPRAED